MIGADFEPVTIDDIVNDALDCCDRLPETPQYRLHIRRIRDLRERLAGGRMHIAVLGQFNRGKSTFINALLSTEIMPVSVLPLTSVPTFIAYGSEAGCTIRFADGREVAAAGGDAAAVTSQLCDYVTEEGNPRNRLRVSDAKVECDSPLLRHGTVLIDTPGFGSTHVHNTETSLELLASCDAALFLLSADLPITRVEVDFLRRVIGTVPRLFFIYNKTDLLDGAELRHSRDFVRGVLAGDLGLGADIRLFPVSARNGLGVDRLQDPELWHECGLAAVEQEIIDFLLRDKYFALSEALTQKLRDAVREIMGQLQARRATVLEPIKALKQNIKGIESRMGHVREALNDELDMIERLRQELRDKCDVVFARKSRSLQRTLEERLPRLVPAAAHASDRVAVLSDGLSRDLGEMLNVLFLCVVAELNQILHGNTLAYVRRLEATARRERDTDKSNGLVDMDTAGRSVAVRLAIEAELSWRPEPVSLTPPGRGIFAAFLSARKRAATAVEHYLPQTLDNLDANMRGLEAHIKSEVSAILSRHADCSRDDHCAIVSALEARRAGVAARLRAMQQEAEPELSRITELIKGFAKVQNRLA